MISRARMRDLARRGRFRPGDGDLKASLVSRLEGGEAGIHRFVTKLFLDPEKLVHRGETMFPPRAPFFVLAHRSTLASLSGE
jgi:hypothetical protein